MINKILSALNFLGDVIEWLINSDNRSVALKYFRMGKEVTHKLTKLTPTDKDDAGLEYLSNKLDKLTKNMSEEELKKAQDVINMSRGKLTKLSVELSKDQSKASLIKGSNRMIVKTIKKAKEKLKG